MSCWVDIHINPVSWQRSFIPPPKSLSYHLFRPGIDSQGRRQQLLAACCRVSSLVFSWSSSFRDGEDSAVHEYVELCIINSTQCEEQQCTALEVIASPLFARVKSDLRDFRARSERYKKLSLLPLLPHTPPHGSCRFPHSPPHSTERFSSPIQH